VNQQELMVFLQALLREQLGRPALQVVSVRGLGSAADFGRASTDQKWRLLKYAPDRSDDVEGVLPLEISFRVDGPASHQLRVLLKARTRLTVGEGLLPDTMQAIGLTLPQPYPNFRSARESAGHPEREIQLYRLQPTVPVLERYLPRYLGDHINPARNEYLLIEQLVEDAILLDSADDVTGWTPARIDTALAGIGAIHGTWYAQDRWLTTQRWLPRRLSTDDIVADTPLWESLAEFVRARFPDMVSQQAHTRRLMIIQRIADWLRVKDEMPHTLVHDDFNPRNCGLRPLAGEPALVVYDWELTLADIPQRDLVEFLTFTLSDNVTREQVDAHIERHRRSVEAAAARTVPTDVWWEGWCCELYLEAINRVPLQWVFHTRYPSRYTRRINRVLEHLLDLYADL
jgi:hypothetical protein